MNTLKTNDQLTIEDVFPKSVLNSDEAIKELEKNKEIEKTVDRKKLFYETNKYKYSFKSYQAIKTFGKDIYDGTIVLKEPDEYQIHLLVEILNFKKKRKPKGSEKKQEKLIVLKNLYNFFEGR